MTDLLKHLDSLSPFLQGVMGSAAFALIILIGRLALRGARHGGKTFFKFMSRDLVLKHIVHKEFVQSRRIPDAVWGNFFVITQSLHWSINAASMLVFVFAVSALLGGNWLLLIGYYLALNALLEANSWLKDRSDEKHVAHVDPEIRKQLLEKFSSKETLPIEKVQANPALNHDAPSAGGAPVS
ncbi:MAG: hypothetical protein AABY73_06830 [Pseudomonadota bacterium]